MIQLIEKEILEYETGSKKKCTYFSPQCLSSLSLSESLSLSLSLCLSLSASSLLKLETQEMFSYPLKTFSKFNWNFHKNQQTMGSTALKQLTSHFEQAHNRPKSPSAILGYNMKKRAFCYKKTFMTLTAINSNTRLTQPGNLIEDLLHIMNMY